MQHFVSETIKEQKDPEMFGRGKRDVSPSDRFIFIKVQGSDSLYKNKHGTKSPPFHRTIHTEDY